MKKLKYKMLGIKTPSTLRYFRDDGYVTDINAHAEKLCEEFGVNPEKLKVEPGILGQMFGSVTDLFERTAIICYTHHTIPEIEIFTRGHEETHALHYLGYFSFLKQELKNHGFNINLSSMLEEHGWCSKSDREFVAHVGGLYSLVRRGRDILKIPTSQDNPPHEFLKARELFLQVTPKNR